MVGDAQQPKTWRRVNRQEPCPICKKVDWCGVSDDGELAICMRIDSDHPARNGGHVHKLSDPVPLRPMLPPETPAPKIDAGEMMARWRKNTLEEQFENLSERLGVSIVALKALGAAFAHEHKAWAFPMYDDRSVNESNAIGIRLRNVSGEKWSVKGSKSGFFFPFRTQAVCDTILIVEGPTDCAAALDLGFFAIGRASCRGGESQILNALEQLAPFEVVMVYDNDGPGVEGANLLATQIGKRHKFCRFVPPTKDLRSFVKSGGTRSVFDSLLTNCIWEGRI